MVHMNHFISAIFDAGVFRPLEPVELAEGTRVQIEVPMGSGGTAAELRGDELSGQQASIRDFLAKMESLPAEGPDDGFSGRRP